jgi:tetratricopeptide (TPR) repeat protein
MKKISVRQEDAEAAFTTALALDPGLAQAWAGRAGVRHARGDARAAVEALTRGLASAPDPAMLYNRGVARQTLGRWQKAVDDFTAALEVTGEEPDLLFERGRSRLGLLDDARRDLTRVLELDDAPERHADVHALLGAVPNSASPWCDGHRALSDRCLLRHRSRRIVPSRAGGAHVSSTRESR